MLELCDACRAGAHQWCDPLRHWCECACFTGSVFDPVRIPDPRQEP